MINNFFWLCYTISGGRFKRMLTISFRFSRQLLRCARLFFSSSLCVDLQKRKNQNDVKNRFVKNWFSKWFETAPFHIAYTHFMTLLATTFEPWRPFRNLICINSTITKRLVQVLGAFSSSERPRGACLSKAALKLGSLDPSFLVAGSWGRASWEL